MGKATNGARAETQQFWKLMTKTCPASALRLRQVDLSALGDKHVQSFEILVVDTLAELCPEIAWSATQVQGDGGVDFLGLAKAIRLSVRSADILFRYTIVGQVKRSKDFDTDVLDSALGKLGRLADKGLSVSQLLFVFSSEERAIDRFRIEGAALAARAFPGVPINVIDADDLVWLWAQFGQERFEVLRPVYSDETFIELRRHLERLAAGWRVPQIVVEAAPATGRRVVGADLDVLVAIRVASPHPGQKFGVRLRPGPAMDLVRPLALLAEPALVAIDDRGGAQLRLRLRARKPGVQPIGELDVFLAGGGADGRPPILTQPLGSVELVPDPAFRYIRFLRAPHAGSESALDRLAVSASARGVEVVAVLGAGGIGKSRLIDELFNRLHIDAGMAGSTLWSLVRVDHDTQRVGASRFLRDCLVGLAFPHAPPDDPRFADSAGAIEEWLARFVGARRGAVKAGVEAIAGGSGPAGTEAAAFVLLTAILARLRDGPLALHLSNMHWADAFETDALLELIHRLSSLESQLPNGVLLILEGREGEMIEAHASSDMTTEAWRSLHESSQHCTRIRLGSWSAEDSRRFLEELIAALAGRPLSDRTLEREVIDYVLKSSLGNPMHMIEHVRLLVDNGWLRSEQDGSAIFDPPAQPPTSLVDLISARVEFINRSSGNDEIVALLRLCAEIGLRTDADLFGAMANALSDARLLATLAQWRVAKLPDAGARDFEFLHESYREGCRRIGWRAAMGEPLRRAALVRLSPLADQPAERVIAACRLTLLQPDCDLAMVAADLETALARHEAEPQAVIALCRELLQLPRHVLDRGRGWFALTCLLADTLVWYGDWEEALQLLERARRDVAALAGDHAVEIAQLAHRAGNLLGDVHRMQDGIEAVCAGLDALDHRSSQQCIRLRELLDNRLGVLLWFSGRLDEGIGYQFRALRSAIRNDPGGDRELLFANEVGMSMTFRYPRRGLRLLERAVALLERLGEACSPGCDYVRVQRDIVRLVLAETGSEVITVRDDVLHFLKTGRPSVYGEALGWLAAGACEMLLGEREAARADFREAMASAARCRNLRLRWKAHLAYASASSVADGAPSEISHARHAGHLLADSLGQVAPDKRDAWAHTIRLPLEHARRLCGGDARLDAVVAAIDRGTPPAWLREWDSRPAWLSRAGQPFQILHVRSGAADIFLMG